MSSAGEVSFDVIPNLDELSSGLADATDMVEDFAATAESPITLGLDVGDALSGIGDVSSALEDLAGQDLGGITSSLGDLTSSLGDVSSTADSAATSLGAIDSTDFSGVTSGAAGLTSSLQGADQAAQSASEGLSLMDGITLGAGIAAVEMMISAAESLLAVISETVAMYGELEAASTIAAMRSTTATTTAGYIVASKQIQDKAMELAPDLGAPAAEITKILSTYPDAMSATADALRPMASVADITQSNISDVYSSQKQLSMQFGVKDYSRISDIEAAGYAKTGYKPGDLSGRAGVTLAGMGMGLEEAVATTGTMGKIGINATSLASALASASSKLASSSAELVTKTNKKGEITSQKMKYEGVGEALSTQGLDVQNAKAKGLKSTLMDMYKSGISIADTFKGRQGVILQAYAEQQAAIEANTTALKNSAGQANILGAAIEEDLTEKTEKATIAVDTAKIAFGSLFEEPSKSWQDGIRAMANGFTDLVDRIKETDVQTAVAETIDKAVTYLENLDYRQIGQNLLTWLQSGWRTATDLFGSFLASDTELTGAFSAIKDVLGPTMDNVFHTLYNSGVTAINALGEGFITLENTIGGGLTGAVYSVIGALADLAQAADVALGGSLSKIIEWAGGDGETKITKTASDMSAASSSSSSGSSIQSVGSVNVANAGSVNLNGVPAEKQQSTALVSTEKAAMTAAAERSNAGKYVNGEWVSSLGEGWGKSLEESARTNMVLKEMKNGTTFNVAPGQMIGLDEKTLHTLSINPTTGKEYTDLEIKANQKEMYSNPQKKAAVEGPTGGDLFANLYGSAVGSAFSKPWIQDAVKPVIDELKTQKEPLTAMGAATVKGFDDATQFHKDQTAGLNTLTEVGKGNTSIMEKNGNAMHDATLTLAGILDPWVDQTWKTLQPLPDTIDKASTDIIDQMKKNATPRSEIDAAIKAGAGAGTSGLTDSLAKADAQAGRTSVGFNNLASCLEDMGDCAMSEFGKWQEAQTDLFQNSYIGPGGQAYLDWKKPEVQATYDTQMAMKVVGGARTGMDYTSGKGLDIATALGIDTTEATQKIADLKTDAATPVEMLINAVDNASSLIDEIVARANAGASMPIYTYEVASGGSAENGSLTNIKGYASGIDYVPQDQVAQLHRGERVMTAEENANSKRGGAIRGGGETKPSISIDLRGAFIGFSSVEQLAEVLAEKIAHKTTML